MNQPRVATLVLIVLVGAMFRLVPHPANVTPVLALALFGGAHFPSRVTALSVVLLTMVVSDVALGFHVTMPAVYIAIALSVLLGAKIRQNSGAGKTLFVTVCSSVLFFVITNLSVWAFQELYPKTISGLALCFTAAIPFFKNSLLGDLFYVAVLFGGFRLLETRFSQLRVAST